MGRSQRGDGHAPRPDERQGKRHGHPRAQPSRQGSRHPPRCAAPEEHGRHRRDPGKRHRQVREAGRRHRLADTGHEPVHHADRDCHLRDQMQGRGDLFAAPIEPEYHQRSRAADARSAAAARRSRRHRAVRRAAEHSARERADGQGGSHDRHRRPGDGQGGLRLREAGLRGRRRQRDDGHRRDGRHRRCRAQHAHQQNERQRLGVFGGRQPPGRLENP